MKATLDLKRLGIMSEFCQTVCLNDGFKAQCAESDIIVASQGVDSLTDRITHPISRMSRLVVLNWFVLGFRFYFGH